VKEGLRVIWTYKIGQNLLPNSGRGTVEEEEGGWSGRSLITMRWLPTDQTQIVFPVSTYEYKVR
jgi:hypothetical protein